MRPTLLWLVVAVLVPIVGADGADRVVLKPGRTIDGQRELVGRIQGRTRTHVYVRTADGTRHKIPRAIIERIEECEVPPEAHPARRPDKTPPRQVGLPESPEAENAVLAVAGNEAKVRRTAHYSIVYTSDRSALAAATRLLERVYRRYFAYFDGKGFGVHPPRHKLVAVLYGARREYLAHGQRAGMDLTPTAGFYECRGNLLCLHIKSGGPEHQQALANVRDYEARIDDMRKRLSTWRKGARVQVRYADGRTRTLTKSGFRQLLKEEEARLAVARRRMRASAANADISTISHEATHQLCFNSGLLPRTVFVPVWLSEGFATFFEASRGGRWRGVGKINPHQLRQYQIAKHQGLLVPLDRLVVQRAFLARSPAENVAAYAQAWALTYFLVDKHPKELAAYVSLVRNRRPGRQLTDAQELSDFRTAFGPDLQRIEARWRAYTDRLRED